jgi:hypothetical protein
MVNKSSILAPKTQFLAAVARPQHPEFTGVRRKKGNSQASVAEPNYKRGDHIASPRTSLASTRDSAPRAHMQAISRTFEHRLSPRLSHNGALCGRLLWCGQRWSRHAIAEDAGSWGTLRIVVWNHNTSGDASLADADGKIFVLIARAQGRFNLRPSAQRSTPPS